jgi:hypothetical protein
MMAVRDALGERGESIVRVLLTRLYSRPQPYFRPQFLGDKHPTVDFFVELVGVTEPITPFFFVQVKATTQGYTKEHHHLKVQVVAAEVQRLLAYPAPTYILGVDEPQERGYLLAALAGGPRRIASLPTRYPLDQTTLHGLYEEVLAFWQANGTTFRTSRFV